MIRSVLCAVLLITQSVCCLKILGVFPVAAPSHFLVGFRLMKELADRGHEVTFVSSYPQKTPIKNLKDVPVIGLREKMNEGDKPNFFDLENIPLVLATPAICVMGHTISNYTFATAIQELMKTNQTFDVIVLEEFLAVPLMSLAHYYKAPLVFVCPLGANTWNSKFFGNPAPLSYVPNLLTSFSSHMTFFQRLYNAFVHNFVIIYRYLVYYPKEDALLHRFLPNAPHLSEILYNASLILLNSHPSFKDPLPLLPNMIEVGGYHVSEPKPLPKDLKEFLDSAKDGAIYFSMGSNLKSADIHIAKRNAILKVLGKLKQKVLWKFEAEDVALPKNVKAQKWLPQQDILAHPNVKVFITHGGLLSTIETINHGVPILGIPIFGDQKMNMASAVEKGYGVKLSYNELTEVTFEKALSELLKNPKYSENAKMRSKLFHDRPVKPMDAAVYWIEYVARYGRCEHFRSSSLDLTWYQRSMLDIIAFLATVATVLCLVFYYMVKKIICKQRLYQKEKNE